MRSGKYVYYRLWRLSGSPHAVAVGCAAGVFIGFTPFFGFQFVLAGLLAWALGGSIVASALGTFVANPLSFPVIWYSTYKVGCVMLTGNVLGSCGQLPESLASWGGFAVEQLIDFSMETALMAFEVAWPVIKPMALGSLPVGALAAGVSYVVVRKMVTFHRRRRREHCAAVAGAGLTRALQTPSGPSAQGT